MKFTVAIPDGLLDELVESIVQRLDPPKTELDGYLGVEGAAAYLACERQRIYDLHSAGQIKGYKDGRRVLFLREDLDSYVKGDA